MRLAVALVFLLVGSEKMFGSTWIPLFTEIGLGQWFRYVTGIIQVTGAVLYAIPQSARIGMILLASTMAGAALLHIFILITGAASALIPGFLLGMVVFVWKHGERVSTEGPLTLK